MKLRIALVLIAFGVSFNATTSAAQDVDITPQAAQLAEIIVKINPEAFNNIVDALLGSLEINLRKGGLSEGALNSVLDSFKSALSIDVAEKVQAERYSNQLSPEEIQEIIVFFNGSSGKKLLNAMRPQDNDRILFRKYMLPAMVKACIDTEKQADENDQKLLQKFCGRLSAL